MPPLRLVDPVPQRAVTCDAVRALAGERLDLLVDVVQFADDRQEGCPVVRVEDFRRHELPMGGGAGEQAGSGCWHPTTMPPGWQHCGPRRGVAARSWFPETSRSAAPRRPGEQHSQAV